MSLLRIEALKKHFPVGGGMFGRPAKTVHAVDGVDLSVDAGETLSVVGESGCGKSTLGRVVLSLTKPSAGSIWFDEVRIDTLTARQQRPDRHRIQAVFQDPFSSLSPRMKVRDILAEPLINFRLASTRSEIDARIASLLDQVRLPRDAVRCLPHEFSGGQRQRIGIARALAALPDLIVCDEAVAALDVSVKAQIVNLFQDLQAELNLSLLFISHDLAVVERLTHRVAVMYLGRIVEIADRQTLFSRPAHPYTEALLSAVPVPDPAAVRRRIVLQGDVPNPIDPPPGCRFHPRCPYAFDRCKTDDPELRVRSAPSHRAACHLDALPAHPVQPRGRNDVAPELIPH